MTSPAPRRSGRKTWAKSLSFGRDFLANALGLSRPQLDNWLLSDSVYPHLAFWHSICIQKSRRYNESIQWIKTGYFFEGHNLEEDVILLCLEEGIHGSDMDANGIACQTYGDCTTRTFKWSTVELWARTVWRIVKSNSGKGDIFERAVKFHPASAYGIVFDMLSLAFHNIAWVKEESVWSTLIRCKFTPVLPLTPVATAAPWYEDHEIAHHMDTDANPDGPSEESLEEFEEVTDDDEIYDLSDDSDFSSDSEVDTESVFLETPKKARGSNGRKVSPSAPTKNARGNKRVRDNVDDEDSPSRKIKKWAQSLPPQKALEHDSNNMLKIFDENGRPITGYRPASISSLPILQHTIAKKPVIEEDTIVLRRDSAIWSKIGNEATADGAAENLAVVVKVNKVNPFVSKKADGKACAAQ